MLVDLFAAMGAVLGTWVVLITATIGVGALVVRAFGTVVDTAETVLVSFWMGFAATVLALQVWNYFWPIQWHGEALLLAAGAIGVAVNARGLGRWLAGVLAGPRWALVLFALLVLWTANQAIGSGDAHDSGMYHYGAIRWANEHPVVPGVANLSLNIGLNSSSLLHAAMLNVGPWHGMTNHISPGFLIVPIFAQWMWGVWGLLVRRDPEGPGLTRDRMRDVFNVSLIVSAVMIILMKDGSSPKTDWAPGAVVFVIGAQLISFLRRTGLAGSARARDRALAMVFLTVMCSTAVCMKLTVAFVAVTVWSLVAAVYLWREVRGGGGIAWRPMAAAVAVSAALVGTWMGRNLIMSGYPLYPSTALGIDADWRTPEEYVALLQENIHVHAKTETPHFLAIRLEHSPFGWYTPLMRSSAEDPLAIEGWNWLRPWFFTLPVAAPVEVVLPAGVMLACFGVLAVRRRRGARSEWFHLWSVPAMVGVAAWFLTVPSQRFGFVVMWLACGGVMAAAAEAWCGRDERRWEVWGKRIVILSALLALPTIPYRMYVTKVLEKVNPLTRVPFEMPGPEGGFHPKPSFPLNESTTRWGLVVKVPPPGATLQVGDPPLPATAWPGEVHPDLRLRREGDLRSGFRIDPSGR